MIYPILDSNWVSLVLVVPKIIGITIVKNQNDKLVSTRVPNKRWACIYYRKLNVVTCKDHFPLPFFDEILKGWLVILTIVSLMVIQAIFRL